MYEYIIYINKDKDWSAPLLRALLRNIYTKLVVWHPENFKPVLGSYNNLETNYLSTYNNVIDTVETNKLVLYNNNESNSLVLHNNNETNIFVIK